VTRPDLGHPIIDIAPRQKAAPSTSGRDSVGVAPSLINKRPLIASFLAFCPSPAVHAGALLIPNSQRLASRSQETLPPTPLNAIVVFTLAWVFFLFMRLCQRSTADRREEHFGSMLPYAPSIPGLPLGVVGHDRTTGSRPCINALVHSLDSPSQTRILEATCWKSSTRFV